MASTSGSPGRTCTRRTCTPTGPASHGSPSGSPRRRPAVPEHHTDLHHHDDQEATDGLLDLAVNVYAGPRPGWLDDALRDSLADVGAYPDPTAAEAALARHHGRHPDEVLATAGAADAFTLLARARRWRRPVIVHPQFTEPHA